MLTNTLLLYVTQEAWAKARARLVAVRHVPGHDEVTVPRWLKEVRRRKENERPGGSYQPPHTRH
jgi:hypothetical protein